MTETAWRPRTLERLDGLIRHERSDQARRILLVKKACALTRFSHLQEAGAILERVRSEGRNYDPRLSAWIMLCEGLMQHFGSLAERAGRDFKRSYAVSVAAGDFELAAIASAWIASAELTAGNFAAVPGAIVQTFTHADPGNCTARARAGVVIADMHNWAGDTATARTWYKRARDAAAVDGDLAMQSVAMYNDAAHRVWQVVLNDCRGTGADHAVMLASTAVDSVSNLDLGLGLGSLSSMIPLLRAEVRTVQGTWDEALGLFDAYLRDQSVEVQQPIIPKFQAQRAYCLAMSGEHRAAVKEIELATRAAVNGTTDFDDLFVLHTRAASIFEHAAMPHKAQAHRESAARCLEAFSAYQAELMASIGPMMARVTQLDQKKEPGMTGLLSTPSSAA